MQRLKYINEDAFIYCETHDIFNNRVLVTISKGSPRVIIITKSRGTREMQKRVVELVSLQGAKRRVRKLLKEEFEVNLREEVRKVLQFD